MYNNIIKKEHDYMSIRIVWSEHEQAVLLQALIDVLNHKIERKQAISEVSKRLRKEAELMIMVFLFR